MNTTNLLVDYVISGAMGFTALLLPLIMIDRNYIIELLNKSNSIGTVGAIFITVILYAIGIVFYQFSEFLEKKLFCVLRIKYVKQKEADLESVLGMKYHDALQYIVYKSEQAYDYLSFRRTIIRILRTVLSFGLLSPIFHLLYVIYFLITGHIISFSLLNLFICLACLLLSFFIVKMLIKVEKGYYSAIINFVQVIK